jgi:pyruvate formate lyase activating enzyme
MVIKMSSIICDLCPKYCNISPGKSGDCKTRYNYDGTLIALTYERPAVLSVDPIEKKPLYHVLPGSKSFSLATVGCNFHCKNCQNSGLSQVEPLNRKAYNISVEKIIGSTKQKDCSSIALTYSDPVVFYEYSCEIGKLAKQNKLLSLWITAGYINQKPLINAIPYIDAVNLDIKAFNNSFYKEICDGTLKPVLETAVTLKKHGVWLEITNLVIPGKNDSPQDFKKLSKWIKENLGADVPLHFSRFFPHYKLRNIPPTPPETLFKAKEIAVSEGLNFVYLGNMRGKKGENTYCPYCGELLIGRIGYTVYKGKNFNGICEKCKNSIPGRWK